MIVSQKAPHGDGCIIGFLLRILTMLISLFTAEAVEAIANAIQKAEGFPVNGYRGKVSNVFIDGERIVGVLMTKIRCEVIACTQREIEDLMMELHISHQVNKTVQCAVTAAQNKIISGLKGEQVPLICLTFCHVAVHDFVRKYTLKHGNILFTSSVSSERIVENICFRHSVSFQLIRICINSSPVMVSLAYKY